jgi:hypothetical protein
VLIFFHLLLDVADKDISINDQCRATREQENSSSIICDQINLRKVLTCPTGQYYICPAGTICSAVAPAISACVPLTQDLGRFCSNKPLFSSYCIPMDPLNRMVVCGYEPSILACPVDAARCTQRLSIIAKCVPRKFRN